MWPPRAPSLPFILSLHLPTSLSLFFSHSASLLNSALTSALPKTTTKESRSLAFPGWSWVLVPAESGDAAHLSENRRSCHSLCPCLANGAWSPRVLKGRVGVHTRPVSVHWLPDGARLGFLHPWQHSTCLLWSWCCVGIQRSEVHTLCPVNGKPACKYTFIHTQVCTGPTALPSQPCSSGASHRVFPLLSMVIGTPILLERLPNMLIGTPAMIKRNFR